MSQENVETLRRANEAFHRGDFDAVEAAYHPDVIWQDLQHAPDAPPEVRGIDAVKRIWKDWIEAFPDLRADVTGYVDAGDSVVCVVHWHGRGKESGAPIDLRTIDAYELRDGAIARVTIGYRSTQEALKAAGFADNPA
jgi:ketosteroid isomerase-like protein